MVVFSIARPTIYFGVSSFLGRFLIMNFMLRLILLFSSLNNVDETNNVDEKLVLKK